MKIYQFIVVVNPDFSEITLCNGTNLVTILKTEPDKACWGFVEAEGNSAKIALKHAQKVMEFWFPSKGDSPYEVY